MNLKIKKSNRSAGFYFHKMPRLGASKCKRLALKHISKECGKNKFFSKNYIQIESKIIQDRFYDYTYLQI